jgi:hypothetical protein
MKRAITAAIAISVAIFTAPAQATDVCVSGYDLIVRLGKSRDTGVPMSNLMSEAATLDNAELRKIVEQLIAEVYSHPETPVQHQAAAFYKGCREPVSKSKTVAPGTNRGGV